MLSSVLNPNKIINQKQGSPESFQRFMTGGESPLGSSVISSAANKIVGFSRVGVSPVTPDINSMLSDISTNIISNVDNSIKNTTNFVMNDVDKKINALRSEIYGRLVDVESSINDLQSQTYSAISNVQQNVSLPSSVQSVSPVSDIPKVIENIQVQAQETLNTTLSNFSKDYQEKIKGINDVKPKNVLDKFLDLYRNAIGFINFFSDRKNINRITENLKSIRGIFDNTFNVAKILRETILKIVKQLTNLPSASATSPGLDLNVNIPGGGLKQSAGSQVSKVGRALKFGALGLGAVGLGAAGAEAAKRFQEQELYKQTEISGSDLPQNFIELFSSIIDKFESAVESLIGGAKSSQQTTPSVGGGGRSPGGGGSPGGGSAALPQEGSSEEYRIAAALVTEGGSGLDATDILQVAANRIQSGKYGKSYTDVFAQPGQFQGVFDRGIDNYKNIKTKEDAAKFAGVSTQEIDKRLSSIRDPSLRAQSAEFVQGALEFRASPFYYQKEGLVRGEMDASGKFYNSKWRGTSGSNQFLIGPKDPKISAPAQINLSLSGQDSGNLQEPQVSTSLTQTQAMQATSRSISQPAQQVPTTISLPPTIIDASPPQQPTSGSSTPPPPSGGSGSIEVPFLPTSNPNNFYVLYSRTVYNVVDG